MKTEKVNYVGPEVTFVWEREHAWLFSLTFARGRCR